MYHSLSPQTLQTTQKGVAELMAVTDDTRPLVETVLSQPLSRLAKRRDFDVKFSVAKYTNPRQWFQS